MATRGRPIQWTIQYQRKCFDAWYLSTRPTVPVLIRELIPPDENGNKPGFQTIGRWLRDSWQLRANELDIQVDEKADTALVNKKVVMLKRHQEQAMKVEMKALDYIMQEGFDSSASAVQAFFKAMEEERKTEGFSDLLEKLENMTNNQVRDQIINLINRAASNDQIVESSIDIPELEEENAEVSND